MRIDFAFEAGSAVPVTNTKRRIGQSPKCVTMARIERHGVLEIDKGLRRASQILQNPTPVVMPFGIVRADRERLVITGQRFVQPPQISQGIARLP